MISRNYKLTKLTQVRGQLCLEIDQILADVINSGLNKSPGTPMERLLVPFLHDLIRSDSEQSINVLENWRSWLQNGTIGRVEDFRTLDQYLEYHRTDLGVEYVSNRTINALNLISHIIALIFQSFLGAWDWMFRSLKRSQLITFFLP